MLDLFIRLVLRVGDEHDTGFRVVFDVETVPEDGDRYQDHLNNGAPVRMFNELRMAYVAAVNSVVSGPGGGLGGGGKKA